MYGNNTVAVSSHSSNARLLAHQPASQPSSPSVRTRRILHELNYRCIAPGRGLLAKTDQTERQVACERMIEPRAPPSSRKK